MPAPKNLDPSSPREFYGAELRYQREAAGLTQAQLGERVYVSGSFIGQLEVGMRRMPMDLAQRIDRELDTDGYFERHCAAVRRSKHAEFFADVAEMEVSAVRISSYAAMLVTGLLQTESYARAVFRAVEPLAPRDEIERRVQARMERARLLADPTSPQLWVILDENVLRRPVGGALAMAEQLRHIAGLVRDDRIYAQVLPFDVGAHASQEGGLFLLEFVDAPTVAYVEGLHWGRLVDDPAAVARCEQSYDFLRAAALPREASLSLIESAAEDFDHDRSTGYECSDMAEE
ncbi:helix-turn-helix domain-containing protein [Streptomyces sp. URMC 123]|uniref:helix-turn-helix domain-containing protein n=1 Tax=Streptomyces sp. URMC 123 TaxID=3423403 RepID=UPI003F1AD8A1